MERSLQLATILISVWLAIKFSQLQKGQSTMATRADLDTAIDNLTTVFTNAIADLKAAVLAGTVTTPEDFAAELDKITAMTAAATAADPGPQPTGDAPTA